MVLCSSICQAMQLQILQPDTFWRHVRMYLDHAIVTKWNTGQYNLFTLLIN